MPRRVRHKAHGLSDHSTSGSRVIEERTFGGRSEERRNGSGRDEEAI